MIFEKVKGDNFNVFQSTNEYFTLTETDACQNITHHHTFVDIEHSDQISVNNDTATGRVYIQVLKDDFYHSSIDLTLKVCVANSIDYRDCID